MPSFFIIIHILPLCSKKMDSNLLFSRIIEDYKTHLRESYDNYLSFEAFCAPYHIRVKNIRQWMWRHGLTVSTFYYSVLLEKYNSDPDFILPSPTGSRKNVSSHTGKTHTYTSSSPQAIKGICLTFPDGIVINIRQTTASELTKFIDSYNKLNDRNHVQPK